MLNIHCWTKGFCGIIIIRAKLRIKDIKEEEVYFLIIFTTKEEEEAEE